MINFRTEFILALIVLLTLNTCVSKRDNEKIRDLNNTDFIICDSSDCSSYIKCIKNLVVPSEDSIKIRRSPKFTTYLLAFKLDNYPENTDLSQQRKKIINRICLNELTIEEILELLLSEKNRENIIKISEQQNYFNLELNSPYNFSLSIKVYNGKTSNLTVFQKNYYSH